MKNILWSFLPHRGRFVIPYHVLHHPDPKKMKTRQTMSRVMINVLEVESLMLLAMFQERKYRFI